MRLARTGTACILASCLLASLVTAEQVQPAEHPSRWDAVVFEYPEEVGRSYLKRLEVMPESLPRWDVEVFKHSAQPENAYIKRLGQLPSER